LKYRPAKTHAEASAINRQKTGRGLSQQAFGIGRKIKQVDDAAMTPECQQWAFEVYPEVCFWALNGERPMVHNKKTEEGLAERLALLSPVFPEIERHLAADHRESVETICWMLRRRLLIAKYPFGISPAPRSGRDGTSGGLPPGIRRP